MTAGKNGWALKFQRTKDQNNTKTQRAIYKRHNYWTLCFINFACNIGNSFLRTRWQQLADIQNRCLEREELCYKFGVYYICIIFCIVVLTLMSHAINIHIFSWYALGMVEQLLKIGNAWFDKLPQKQRKIGSWLMKEYHEVYKHWQKISNKDLISWWLIQTVIIFCDLFLCERLCYLYALVLFLDIFHHCMIECVLIIIIHHKDHEWIWYLRLKLVQNNSIFCVLFDCNTEYFSV